MRNFWKYLLIFLGVFAVVFVAALVLFGARYGMGGFGSGMMFGGQHPMMGRGGFMGFGLLRGFLGLALCLVPLGLLALLAAGVVALVRRPGAVVPPIQSATPHAVEPAAPQPVVVVPLAQVQPDTHACPHCGQPVQNNWVACPYCGGDLKDTPA